MGCDVSGEQLWSWIDRDAPELEAHLAACPACRAKAAGIREEIKLLAGDASAEIPVPEKIGPYAIRRLIGEGGQALVYEAEQPSPQRPVALKLLKGGQLVDKNRLRHFRREIQSLARLNHPAIATIYEAGRTQDGLHYFAMELVDGAPLHTYVKQKRLTRIDRLRLFLKVCGAVQYAHDQGIVHRDLKPSNIMVSPEGEPKILDFGLARVTLSDTAMSLTLSREGRVEGTPRYMSPEQIRGAQDQIDHRTDVYALGVILYELMTGTPPKAITTVSPATIRTLCEETPPVPSSIDSSLRGDLDALVMKALENEREDRYASVKDLAEDVSRYLEGKPIAAKRPTALYLIGRRAYRRAPLVSIILAVVAVIAALAYTSWRGNRPPPDPLFERVALLDTRCRLLEDGPIDPVYQQTQEALSRYPGMTEAVLVYAQGRYLRRHYTEAAATLARALESGPSSWAYGSLLKEIEARQNPTSARPGTDPYWNDKLARSAEAWYLRSFATLDVDSALAWAKEAVARDPAHRLALTAIAHISETKGDDEAYLAATDVLVRIGYRPHAWLRSRAEFLARTGRLEEALAESNRLVSGWPDNYNGLALRARLARRIGRYADAERDFSAALGATGITRYEEGWLFYHLGSLRWLTGHASDAAADYKAARDLLGYPTYANARLYILLRELGRTDEAEGTLADGRRTNVDDPWLGHVFECLDGSLTPESLVAIAESTGNAVKICEGYYYAAEAARLAGRDEDAHAWFEKCVGTGVECDPDNVLESQSEFQLARMRLSQLARTANTSDRE